jgi:rare lipoprotein A (peptidoglycan hydrolase)
MVKNKIMKVLSLLILSFMITMLISNLYISLTYKVSKQKHIKCVEFKPIYIKKKKNIKKSKIDKKQTTLVIPNHTKLDLIKENASHHNATWYKTDGTKVHRDYPTAAYNNVPKGTKLLVINTYTNDSCIVEVTDRNKMGKNHIDLSHSAFGALDKHSKGRIKVLVKVIE